MQANYYIFNTVGKKGFVIVSGDDRTIPILGYTDSGEFDPNNMPENMKAWLENYDQQMNWASRARNLPPRVPHATASRR